MLDRVGNLHDRFARGCALYAMLHSGLCPSRSQTRQEQPRNLQRSKKNRWSTATNTNNNLKKMSRGWYLNPRLPPWAFVPQGLPVSTATSAARRVALSSNSSPQGHGPLQGCRNEGQSMSRLTTDHHVGQPRTATGESCFHHLGSGRVKK